MIFTNRYYYYRLHLFHNSHILFAAQRFCFSSCRWPRATAKQRRHGTVRTVDLTVLVEKGRGRESRALTSGITLYGNLQEYFVVTTIIISFFRIIIIIIFIYFIIYVYIIFLKKNFFVFLTIDLSTRVGEQVSKAKPTKPVSGDREQPDEHIHIPRHERPRVRTRGREREREPPEPPLRKTRIEPFRSQGRKKKRRKKEGAKLG